MKSLLAPLALGLLTVGIAACGSSGPGKASSPSTTSGSSTASTHVSSSSAVSHTRGAVTSQPTIGLSHENIEKPPKPTRRELEKYDRDEDDYQKVVDDHNPVPFGFTPADAADRKAITGLVRRYYAAALADNGARGCAMMLPSVAKAVPLDYGRDGAFYLRRAKGTCAAVMSLMFKHEHRLLAREVPVLQFVRVAVHGNEGQVILRFGLHERGITEEREGKTWMMSALLDGELE